MIPIGTYKKIKFLTIPESHKSEIKADTLFVKEYKQMQKVFARFR